VTYTFSFFTSVNSLLYLLQTLTALDLGNNQIGSEGAQAIAQALERNQVRYIFNFLTSVTSLLYLLQTLTMLRLDYNQIGPEGAQAIAQALDRNKVRHIFSFSLLLLVFYICYRRSQNSTLPIIKLDLKVDKQLAKH